MRRAAIAIVLVAIVAALVLFLRHRAPGGAHAPTTTPGDLGGASAAAGKARPAPPLRLPTATVRPDATVATGEFGGRVLSSADGKPIAGASLTFLHEGAAVSTEADAAGRFSVRATAPGAYELTSASAKGFAPFEPMLGHSPVTVWARAGVRLEDVTVYLTPALELTVLVTDDKSKPLAGAEVRAFDDRRGPDDAKAVVTDAKGHATLSVQPWDFVEARHAGYKSALAPVNLQAQTSGQLVLKLTAGSEPARLAIGGHVVDARGQPVDGALVEAFPPPARDEGEESYGAQTLSGADGRFTLAGLVDGTYTVRAATRAQGGVVVRGIKAGATDVELELGATTAMLRGIVTDGDGKPIPAFTIVAWPREGILGRGPEERATVIAPDGRYALPLAAGTYVVSAAARGFAKAVDRSVEVGEAGAEADFQLARGSRIFGRVVERVGGAPIAGAIVAFEGNAIDDPIGISTDVTSGADGSFAIEGVPGGRQSINVQAAGHNGRLLGGLVVPKEGALGPLTIDLAKTPPGEEPTTEFVGISAVMTATPQGMLVKSVSPGGGASDAGIIPGDLVLSIDGQDVEPLGFVGAIQMIRGPEGSVVTLVVKRTDGSVQTIPVVRKRVSF